MENDEIILEEDIVEDDEIVEDKVAEEAEDIDDEFEYDEEGNIIIPDVVEDDEDATEDVEEEPSEKAEKEQTEDGEETFEEKVEATPTESVESQKVAELERELAALRSQAKDTLAKLGVKDEDITKGLATLAAEASEMSVEDYLKQRTEAQKNEEAQALLARMKFEQMAQADLRELQAAFPETKGYSHIRDLPDEVLKKFGKFRDMGLSAKEAYSAANPDGIRNNVASAVKKQSLQNTKSHLHSNVPKGSKDNGITMTKSELAYWRDLFPGKSDREIMQLYKNTAD